MILIAEIRRIIATWLALLLTLLTLGTVRVNGTGRPTSSGGEDGRAPVCEASRPPPAAR